MGGNRPSMSATTMSRYDINSPYIKSIGRATEKISRKYILFYPKVFLRTYDTNLVGLEKYIYKKTKRRERIFTSLLTKYISIQTLLAL